MVYVFLADGCEEVEAITPVDILRRGGVTVTTVGVGSKSITGSHGIVINTDISTSDLVLEDIDAVVLPGGMPGTLNLENDQTVQSAIKYAYNKKLLIGAICAAPSILGHMGYLDGKKATCYPGFEDSFGKGEYTGETVTQCGNIVTGKGPGAAVCFGFALLKNIKGEEIMNKVYGEMQCPK